ncbi:MAG: hypothetical protein KAJ55_09060 [Anaerolineales bacterium]|nr:hypothetical protein [Anaerolineales bacterium]
MRSDWSAVVLVPQRISLKSKTSAKASEEAKKYVEALPQVGEYKPRLLHLENETTLTPWIPDHKPQPPEAA